MKPQQLRGRGLEQTLVQVFTPVLAFALVVGGGIGAAFTAPQPAVLVEVELAAQNIEVAATNELAVFELEDFEPEEYHSVAQYATNLEQYKKAISSLRPYKHWQRNRQAQILSSLEIREWVLVGSVGTELCFQHSKTLECVESETLETLREGGKEFAEANPTGIGLCYDWFDEVCMSGDWFDSKERFTSVINATREYVMTGEWPVETTELALETSPIYEPTRSVPLLESDLFTEKKWREIAAVLAPGQDIKYLYFHPFDGHEEGFCVGGERDGDCFSSPADYERIRAELDAWDNNPDRDGFCIIETIWEDGFRICHQEWRGSPGNWYVVDLNPGPRVFDDNGSDPAPDDSGSDPAPDDSGSDPAPDDSGD